MFPPTSAPAFHLGYRAWLDGLRGVAILVVLAGHLHLVPGGFLGVDLFFVLSGFLITTLLLEERERAGRISLRRFYARRALRLFPALAVVLLAGLAYTSCLSAEEAAAFRREALVAGLYLANWPKLHATPMPTLGHTWSLAVEEQFYLLWPLLVCVLLWVGARRRTLFLCAVGGIVASCALRAMLHQSYRVSGVKTQHDIARMYMGLDTRADALLVGCLIGLLAAWGKLPAGRGRRAIAFAGTVALVAFGWQVATRHHGHPQYYDGQFTLVALGLGAVLVHLLVNPARVWRRVLEFPPLVGVGHISYGLYLVHIPLIRWLPIDSLGWAHPVPTLLVGAVSLAAAVALYYGVERPFLRLKSRSWASALPAPENRTEPASPPAPVSIKRAA